MTGFAARPGTDVLPTCSIATTMSATTGQTPSRIAAKRAGHAGS